MHAMLRHSRVYALLVSLMYAAAFGHQLWHGADTTPQPLRELLLWLVGMDGVVAARLVVAVEIGVATAVLVASNRILSMGAAIAFGFASLSCVSAALRAGGVLMPVIALVASIVIVALGARAGGPSLGTDTPARRRRGLSPAWTALIALSAATAAANLSAGIGFRAAPMSEAEAKARARSIDLDLKPFVGRAIEDSPIATYLPSVVAKLGKDTAFIVFYNPHCDACHTLFDANFSGPRSERVIAVEIPAPDDAVIAAHDELGPINCPQCEYETLAPGPLWLVAPPMTVKVENGVIVCVADRFGGDCINPQ